jgi:hypothetical protein
LDKAIIGEPTSFTISCRDAYDTVVKAGGETVMISPSVKVETTKICTEVKQSSLITGMVPTK